MTSASPFRRAVPVLLAVVLTSCGDDEGTDPTPEEAAFPTDYMTTYTEVRDLRLSNNHDGSFSNVGAIRVHAAPAAAATAYTNLSFPLPDGTTLVKTQYADPAGNTLTGFTVMQKRAGFAPGSGDWYWQTVDADRNVVESGAVAECITCHVADTDCGASPVMLDYTRTCP
ncbi:MAG: cytochrome P460 family protein [Candidatus Eiseniibacteriota bacterium]